MVYWVQDYWYNGSNWTGYWDEYNYNYFSGDSPEGGAYYIGYTYYGPGPAQSFYSDHVIFGNSENWGEGSCNNPPKVRDLSPEYGAPASTQTMTIKGNGFTNGTTVELNPTNSNISFTDTTYVNPQKITVKISPDANMSGTTVNVRVNRSGTPSNTKEFDVRVPHHVEVLYDMTMERPSGTDCTQTPRPIIRYLRMEVVDSNGDRTGPVPVKENFTNVSSNTCHPQGLGPNASGCALTDPNGNGSAFTDAIAVNCGYLYVGCGYTISYTWQWCPVGRTGTPFNIASFTETVHSDSITINGNSTSIAAGTDIYP